MNFVFHGATLALAWFMAANVVLSAAVAMVVHVAWRTRRPAAPSFALRVFPAAASAVFVAGVFVPSYWRFEPRDFAEGFVLTLTVFAAAAALLIFAAGVRATAACWRAARRVRAWTAMAVPLDMEGVRVPAFRIDASQPVMALVGILRPRLLVTRGLIEALTPDELAASVAHEVGHRDAWDNLKRLIMVGAPDVLHWMPAAGQLERQWAAQAEHRADVAAAGTRGRSARLALASALVKVARLMPEPTAIGEPISTLVSGGEIAARVQRLIDDGADSPAPVRAPSSRWAARSAAVLVAIVGLAFVYAPLLETVHDVTEILVHRLP